MTTKMGTKIIPVLSEAEIEREVERIVIPEFADAQAKPLLRLIYEIADFEQPEKANAARSFAFAVFRQTTDYDRAVKEAFQRFVESAQEPPVNIETKKSDELQQTVSSRIH